LDVSVDNSAAQLAPADSTTYLKSSELTQQAPLAFAGGSVSFTFQVTAPSAPGMFTLYGNGLSCNNDSSTGGDNESQTSLQVSVAGGGQGGQDAGTSGSGAAGPTVVLLNPSNGQALSGLVSLQATAQSAAGISNVTFLLNELPLGSVTAPAYVLTFDSKAWPDGQYQFVATATDATGAVVSTSPVTVSIANTAASGCAAAPASGHLAPALLLLTLALRARRRG
jgi:hypothetical protein